MKNNDDHQQVVMHIEVFQRVAKFIGKADFKHLRKFNTAFRDAHKASIALDSLLYRKARYQVLSLNPRFGKIVFVKYRDDRDWFTPMQLIGPDPKCKTHLRVRTLCYRGLRVVDHKALITSVEGRLVHAVIDTTLMYWSSGPCINMFTHDNDEPHSKTSYGEYMKIWNARLK